MYSESRGILPVSDWTKECCFVGTRESLVTQLLVQGTSLGQQMEGKEEEEKDELWKKFVIAARSEAHQPGPQCA